MRKCIFLFLFFFSFLFSNSQSIDSDTVIGVNCYRDGAILLQVSNINQYILEWYYEDDLLGWVLADTINDITFSVNKDSIWTKRCTNFRLNIMNSLSDVISSRLFWVPCRLGISPGQDNVKCFGDSTGRFQAVAFAGDSPYDYEWFKDGVSFSSNNTDTLFNNLTVGAYKVIVTDSIGCQDSVFANITSPALLEIDTVFTFNVNCRGDNTGSVVYSIYGGKQYVSAEKYDYLLIKDTDTVARSDRYYTSPNFSSVITPYQINFDSLFAGEYIMSIIDSFDCVLIDTFVITEPAPYNAYGSTTFPLICESDSGYFLIDSITGGGNINYGFVGTSSDSIYVQSGFYDIYIQDLDFGCIDTIPIYCAAQYNIDVYSTVNNLTCYGNSSGIITIDSILGGNIPYDIQWGGLNPNSLDAGHYSVLVVDNIGCVHEELFQVSQPIPFSANPIVFSPLCYGDLNGSISINPTGGTGSLSYYWMDGTGSVDSIYSLSTGVYSLILTDSVMCTDTIDIILDSPSSLELVLANYQNPLSCSGATTSIDVLVNGGVGPYNILWDDGISSLQRVVSAGYYYCEVVDANGCTTSEDIMIYEPDSLEISLLFNYQPCSISGSDANISISGGVEPINILWNTGETSLSIDSLFGDNYWVVVTDSCGNTDSIGYVVPEFILETSLTYDENISHIGLVEVLNSSTGGPFSHYWIDIYGDTISNNSSSGVLCEGTYFIITNDLSVGCSVVDTLYASFYLPNGLIDINTTTVFGDDSLWNAGPYTYLWDTGVITAHADICPGYHWVEVTDNNNCMVRQDIEITPILISVDPAEAIIECNIENLDVTLEIDVIGGTPPYTYEWSNGSSDVSIDVLLNPGNYTVNVVDYNSCLEDTSFIIATMTADCIPNVFTPNGDNVNDFWNLEDTFLYSDSEIKIYGRYGRLIFESIGYYDAWDGKNINGNQVPDGTYFYSINIGHGFDDIRGTVTIVR